MTLAFLIALGLVLLTVGADLLLRGATAIARRFGLSELLIGLTLVGFGTSTPELVSSVSAALDSSAGLALGNVVGSNIANILLILGLSAAIAPFAVEPRAFRRDGAALALATTLIVVWALVAGGYGRLSGLVFLAGMVAYIAYAYYTEQKQPASPETRRHEEEARDLPRAPQKLVLDLGLCLSGFALLVLGAGFLIDGASGAARALGASETLIGLTIVAIGTSLPELAASLSAALKGKSDLALGNVVGSNIYNSLGILGATAAIAPVAAPPSIVSFDNWVMIAATAAMILFATTGRRLSRLEGIVLVVGYAAFMAAAILRG